MRKRKLYPSQQRYEDEHPTITFRVTLEEKDKIENLAHHSSKNISELVRHALLDVEINFTTAYNNCYEVGKRDGEEAGYTSGFIDGRKKGTNEWAIWVPCWKCGKLLYITPNSTYHKETIAEMRGRLSHETCPLK